MAARPPAFSPESTISHEGPFYTSLVSRRSLWARDGEALKRGGAYDVVETLGSTQTRWAHANDENVDVAAVVLSVYSSVQAGGGGGVRAG